MKLVTAKKDHWCSLCLRKIPKGHRYWQREPDKGYDIFSNVKEHTNCIEYEREAHRDENS